MRRFLLPTLLLVFAAGCGELSKDTPQELADDPNAPVVDLLTARKTYQTQITGNANYVPDGPVDPAPTRVLQTVRFPAPTGRLAAYVTNDPGDGKKHPAVVWAHGGFGGINGGSFWATPDKANDQTASAFREKGLVLMVPSWRGENDNPGRFELFYGEVEDVLAARDYLAGLPFVDPDRIYLAGHSTGGTIALLAATATDKFRAIFSFGGAPDLSVVLADGNGYGNTPFDLRDPDEAFFRSPTNFVRAIKTPTFYFEGCRDGYRQGYCPDADKMMAKALRFGVPFQAFALPWGDHFSILHKTTRQVATKIAEDKGKVCTIAFTKQEVGAR
jgi:dipeptidyl aminopeptidase/acylaminoacyl peptidase